jgi:hypothetical protein
VKASPTDEDFTLIFALSLSSAEKKEANAKGKLDILAQQVAARSGGGGKPRRENLYSSWKPSAWNIFAR